MSTLSAMPIPIDTTQSSTDSIFEAGTGRLTRRSGVISEPVTDANSSSSGSYMDSSTIDSSNIIYGASAPYPNKSEGNALDSDSDENANGDPMILTCTFESCSKVFTSRWSLKRHIRTHTGEKPFLCMICGKQFVQKCSLSRHEQTHVADKQYVCEHFGCGKKFKLKEYLDVHKRTHMKSDEVDDDMSIGIGRQNSSHNSASLCDQLRQRLVRLTIGFREQLSVANTREKEANRKLKEYATCFREAMTLLTTVAPDIRPDHLLTLMNDDEFERLVDGPTPPSVIHDAIAPAYTPLFKRAKLDNE